MTIGSQTNQLMNKLFYILLIFLTGCYITSYNTDPVYEDYTEEVYYYNDAIYFGYNLGYYYYYGIPHYWPWWYYYTYRPATHYHIHTHVHVHCPSGSFVYAHRDKKFDNKKEKCTKNSWSDKLYRPQSSRWVLPDNKIQYNKNNRFKQNNKPNYNFNKTNYNRTFNINQSKINNNTRINKPNNSKPNRSNNTKIKSNRKPR